MGRNSQRKPGHYEPKAEGSKDSLETLLYNMNNAEYTDQAQQVA